jgi:uncharacterized protein (DUF427 family)
VSESVWDYPRPPRIEPSSRRVRVLLDGVTIVDTMESFRVLETSLPPSYYIAKTQVLEGALEPAGGRTTACEWKGVATYFDVVAGGHRAERAAWSYADPYPDFEQIRDAVAFYPWAVNAFVDDERVQAQEGGFYGGWITSELIGPFKGAPGTAGW